MELLNHIGYAILALSFVMLDLFWLRCISVASCGVMIVSELSVGHYESAKTLWSLLFIAINGWRLYLMVIGERAVRFSEEERELYETIFRNFTKLEFMKLLRAGQWATASPGQTLTIQGQPVPAVMLISSGLAEVLIGGRKAARLGDGQLVGEMSFITGQPASATVTALEPTRYLAWPKESLRKLLHRNPAMRFAMSHVMGTEVTQKLIRTAHGTHSITPPTP